MSDADDNFDELDAVRRFPSERDWLDLPLPDGLDAADAGSFADRVLQARNDERELDDALGELDERLPPELLAHFAVPAPSAGFVDDTVAEIREDRRQRWQLLLARYVAPEPSPRFVSRTLSALRLDDASPAARSGARTARRAPYPFYGLLAAAAALLLWLLWTDAPRQPLEVRLADQAPRAEARSGAASPMAAIYARVHRDAEPFAIVDAPADGLWLAADLARDPDGGGQIR